MVPGFVPSQAQDFAEGFAEVPVSSFLQPDEVPLDGSTALWHISSANMLGIRPSINLWDTLLVTGLQLDLVSLVTTSWAQLCVRLSTSGKMAEHILPSTEAVLLRCVTGFRYGQMTYCSFTVTLECLRPWQF